MSPARIVIDVPDEPIDPARLWVNGAEVTPLAFADLESTSARYTDWIAAGGPTREIPAPPYAVLSVRVPMSAVRTVAATAGNDPSQEARLWADLTACASILDQLLAPALWGERFTVQPSPFSDRTVRVARGVVEADQIDAWAATFGAIVDRNRGVTDAQA